MMLSSGNGHKTTQYVEHFPEHIAGWRVTIKPLDEHVEYAVEVDWVTPRILQTKNGIRFYAGEIDLLKLYW